MRSQSRNRKRKKRRRNRNPHDFRGAIRAYMREKPQAQYFEMIRGLHAQGVRINRHGSWLIHQHWQRAGEDFA